MPAEKAMAFKRDCKISWRRECLVSYWTASFFCKAYIINNSVIRTLGLDHRFEQFFFVGTNRRQVETQDLAPLLYRGRIDDRSRACFVCSVWRKNLK